MVAAPTAKHEFLTKRQENLGMYFKELKKHMSPEEAMQIFMQIETAKLIDERSLFLTEIPEHLKRTLSSKK